MLARAVILLLLLFAVASGSSGQSLALRGGVNVDLVVDPLRAASVSVASTKLMWRHLRRPSKITVSTSSPGQRFALAVEAEKVKDGLPVGTVNLQDGLPATELIVDAGQKRNGHCTLRYTATALPSHGIGQDVHLVTYTLTEQ
ncbi:MAG: hypothetical protein R3282_08220 [Rhodothermales bacterium]|nr:hypothetical protein [Rhodothermales bacterium]